MKKTWKYKSTPVTVFAGFAVLMVGAGAKAVQAEVWNSMAGAESRDMGKQALAFLSNELWIHAGDSIRWTFATPEIHTVSFLKPGQVRPPFQVGCPGTTASGLSFTGAACVNSGPLTAGASYTVSFPAAGNFKLVCLVHSRMTGAVHVLPISQVLPHNQAFYDREAQNQQAALLSEADRLQGQATPEDEEDDVRGRKVTAGMSALLGTGGGSQAAAVMRFLGETTVVHVGDTVEWTNPSLMVVHTVTFGTEPANLIPPSTGVTMDSDGVPHAVISSPGASVNSGFISTQNQETIGFPQWPLDVTRFRVTFTAPGTFNYICGLHDVLGMVGKVVVLR
jgi:plastocyanin